MIALLLALQLASAEPGQFIAGGDVATSFDGGKAMFRGYLDYGLYRRLSTTMELSGLPDTRAVTAGLGVNFAMVDSRWWRISIAVFPALTVAPGPDKAPGLPLIEDKLALVGRAGLRINWLAFWGLSFTGRVDLVSPLVAPPWPEVGFGIAARI
ncbi:MAG: hypothetical protein HN348_03510 [Proteobacteria bacterium]|jgi:hypothetical protein|nr:hypothetical protein [Pseudomonadota bacterium]